MPHISFLLTSFVLCTTIEQNKIAPILVDQEGSQIHQRSSGGKKFVLYPAKGILNTFPQTLEDCATYKIFALSPRGATVTVEYPRQWMVYDTVRFVPWGKEYTVSRYKSQCTWLTAPGIDEVAVLLVASRPVSVIALVHNTLNSQEGYLALPVESCGRYYTLITNYFYSFFAVTALIEGNTTFHFRFMNTRAEFQYEVDEHFKPPFVEVFYYIRGRNVYSRQEFSMTLAQYQTYVGWVHGLINSEIMSNLPVAVICGSQTSFSVLRSYVQIAGNSLVEQLFPREMWDVKFLIPRISFGGGYALIVSFTDARIEVKGGRFNYIAFIRNSHHRLEIPRTTPENSFPVLVTSDKPVQIMAFTLDEQDTRKEYAMFTILPESMYSTIYVFATIRRTPNTGYRTEFTIVITAKSSVPSEGICLNSRCRVQFTARTSMNDYWTGRLERASPGRYIIQHVDRARFGALLYGKENRILYVLPVGFTKNVTADMIKQGCRIRPHVDDDLVDNDCDGGVDEELVNSIDDDLDGKVDEDTTGKPYLYQYWTKWSEWACVKNCGENYPLRRYRVCLTKVSAMCAGDTIEQRGFCRGKEVQCPELCPEDIWGEGCENQCPVNCKERCNKWNGTCLVCEAGFKGEYCESPCPRYWYGENCENDCTEGCFSDCDRITGTCEYFFDEMILLCLFAITIGFLPAIIIIFVCGRWARMELLKEADKEALQRKAELIEKTKNQSLALLKLKYGQGGSSTESSSDGYSSAVKDDEGRTGRYRVGASSDLGSDLDF